MKPVTVKQWEKMPARPKSWLVRKALGTFCTVYWQLETPAKPGDCIPGTGSYQTEKFAKEVLEYNRKKLPQDACVRRSLCFLDFVDAAGHNLNPAHTLIEEMVKRGWRCNVWFNPANCEKSHSAQFYRAPGDHGDSFFYDSNNVTDAIAAAALQALGLMQPYPF